MRFPSGTLDMKYRECRAVSEDIARGASVAERFAKEDRAGRRA
jgi:hypothetical protein